MSEPSQSVNRNLIDELRGFDVSMPWCEEFERMVSGMLFRTSNSPEMVAFKLQTMRRLQSFNDIRVGADETLGSLVARRMEVAADFLGRMGSNVHIEPGFFVAWGCLLSVGQDVYINRDVSIYDNAPVFIGNRVLIGPGVCICAGTHAIHADDRLAAAGTSFAHPIRIDDDCWIGARATILPGVRIGKGSTIAAGALVTKDVPPDVVAGGVPAKVLRHLTRQPVP